jgi:pre-mRNA-splicing factor SPF27
MSTNEADTVDVYDALPYYDRDLELFPELKSKVDAELARERAKGPQPTPGALHPRLPPALNLFEVRNPCAREADRLF